MTEPPESAESGSTPSRSPPRRSELRSGSGGGRANLRAEELERARSQQKDGDEEERVLHHARAANAFFHACHRQSPSTRPLGPSAAAYPRTSLLTTRQRCTGGTCRRRFCYTWRANRSFPSRSPRAHG